MNTYGFHILLPWLVLYLAVQSSPLKLQRDEFPHLQQHHSNAEDEESGNQQSIRTGMLELHRLGHKLKSRSNSSSTTRSSFKPTYIMDGGNRGKSEIEPELDPSVYPPVSLPMRVKGVRLIVKNGTKYGVRNSASVRRGVSKKWKPTVIPTKVPELQIVEIFPSKIPIVGVDQKSKLPLPGIKVHKPKLRRLEVQKRRRYSTTTTSTPATTTTTTTSATTTTTTTTTSAPEKVKMKVYIRHTGSESSSTTSVSPPTEIEQLKKERRKNYLKQFVTKIPITDTDHEKLELLCVTPSGDFKQRLSSTLVRRSWNCSGTRPEMPTGRKNMNSVMIAKAVTVTPEPEPQQDRHEWTNFQPQPQEGVNEVEKLIPVFYIPEFQPSPLPVIYSPIPIPVLPLIEQKPIALNNPQPWNPITTVETQTEDTAPVHDWKDGKLKGTDWDSDSLFIPQVPQRLRRRKRPSLAKRMKWHLRRLGNFIKGRGRRNHK